MLRPVRSAELVRMAANVTARMAEEQQLLPLGVELFDEIEAVEQ